MVALTVIFTILVFLTLDFGVQRYRLSRQKRSAALEQAVFIPAVHLDKIPRGVFVAPGHTWVELSASGALTVGGDGVAASLLGEVEDVSLRHAGEHVDKGDVVATLKKGTRTIALRAPVAGRILEVNDDLEGELDMLEHDPFGHGWLCRIEPDALAASLEGLHVGDESRRFVKSELARLRDALARLAPSSAGPALADGGEPIAGTAVQIDDGGFARVVCELFEEGK